MAASFPNAKKVFSQVVNGTTKLVAALFNVAYDEIEALQTLIGSLGSTQSYTDSLKNLLLKFRYGCAVEYKGASDLYIRAGMIAVADASNNVRWRVNAEDLTIDFDDLDTGVKENSTLYYVYLLADAVGTGFAGTLSKSATAPAGSTFSRKIGSLYVNSAGNIDQDSIENLNFWPRMKLGTPIDRSASTAYYARTDGFIRGWDRQPDYMNTYVYSDDNADPSTVVQTCSAGYSGGSGAAAPVGVFIPKGKYWKVVSSTGSPFLQWIPFQVDVGA